LCCEVTKEVKNDVESAISAGLIEKKFKEQLINLVSEKGSYDIAVIPTSAVEEANQSHLIDWFLTNNRC
jgi:hypothetical protein